jgi:heat shock protein HtpX
LVYLAISRSREYIAEEGGAKLAGNTQHLSDALKRLHMGIALEPMSNTNGIYGADLHNEPL